MSLKEHLQQRKVVKKIYLYSSLDKIVEIKFLSEPYPPPKSSIEVSTCTLSNILVWFGGLYLFPSPLLYCGALLRNSWGNQPLILKSFKISKLHNETQTDVGDKIHLERDECCSALGFPSNPILSGSTPNTNNILKNVC